MVHTKQTSLKKRKKSFVVKTKPIHAQLFVQLYVFQLVIFISIGLFRNKYILLFVTKHVNLNGDFSITPLIQPKTVEYFPL